VQRPHPTRLAGEDRSDDPDERRRERVADWVQVGIIVACTFFVALPIIFMALDLGELGVKS
jgi:hypothetical protein